MSDIAQNTRAPVSYSDQQIAEISAQLEELLSTCDELTSAATSTLTEADQVIGEAKKLNDQLHQPLQLQNRAAEAERKVGDMKRRLGLLPAKKSYRLDFGHCTIQGRRPNNEDAHVVQTVQKDGRTFSVAAVFDGHAGDAAALHCAETFVSQLENLQNFPANIKLSLNEAFVATDAEFCEKTKMSGCTAVALVYEQGNDTLFAANAGDARVIYGTANPNEVIEATHDHKPINPGERARIEQAGSFVSVIFGVSRVNGMLAVSRAIGDDEYKQFGVTAEPEVHEYTDIQNLGYVLLACDGLYDVLSNADIDIACRASVDLPSSPQGEKQMLLDKAMRMYLNNQITEADQEILKFQGNNMNYVNFDVCKTPSQDMTLQDKVSVILTRMAYLFGSTDNVTAVFGRVTDI